VFLFFPFAFFFFPSNRIFPITNYQTWFLSTFIPFLFFIPGPIFFSLILDCIGWEGIICWTVFLQFFLSLNLLTVTYPAKVFVERSFPWTEITVAKTFAEWLYYLLTTSYYYGTLTINFYSYYFASNLLEPAAGFLFCFVLWYYYNFDLSPFEIILPLTETSLPLASLLFVISLSFKKELSEVRCYGFWGGSRGFCI